MGFEEIVKKELKDKMPENPKRSVLTKRIILTQKQYDVLQRKFVRGSYNMWCTGVDEGIDPSTDHNLPSFHYEKVGDAKNFGDLFVLENVAEEEAEKAKEAAANQKTP